ncbi:MAG: hypothetical protein WD770_06165 [Actinomycetota bacterium]
MEFRPIGPSPADRERLIGRVMRHPTVQKELGGNRHRLLSLHYLYPGAKTGRTAVPRRYRATIYDYDANRGLSVEGSVKGTAAPKIRELDAQPLPSREEWREAVKVLRRHKELGPRIREGRLIPYRAMPLVQEGAASDGRPGRVLTVGLRPRRGTRGHRIAGVDMGTRSIILLHSHGGACGAPDADQTLLQSATGQGAFRIEGPAGTELWRFEVIRPAATEGEYGSGIELRNVRYRRKLVLAWGGIPIQNVNYEDLDGSCGRSDSHGVDRMFLAYLDPTKYEGWFHVPPGGRDFGGGFRECLAPPSTILESGVDEGNFQGVAIYRDAPDWVLVTELESGWYRYVMEWRLGDDGTIRPRIAWSAVQTGCVCSIHHHHAYWRFDFDIGEASRNRFLEYNQPHGAPKGTWAAVTAEKKVDRERPPPDSDTTLEEIRRTLDRAFRSDHQTADEITRRLEEDLRRSGVLPEPGPVRYWRVENVDTQDAYDIIPGWADGSWRHAGHPFGDGDVWLLHEKPGEREQSARANEPSHHANIDKWVDAEPIDGADVVMWYAVHSTHDGEPGVPHGQLVGPILRPARWESPPA